LIALSGNDFVSVKPVIDRTNLKSVIIKAGRTHKWQVDVTGEPPPTLSWVWRDNIPLTNSERIKIDNVDYHTDFTILNATRRDTGKYTLIAENASGKDSETVELTVLSEYWFQPIFSCFLRKGSSTNQCCPRGGNS